MKNSLKNNVLVLGMLAAILCIWMDRQAEKTCESAWNASILKASFVEQVEMGEIRAAVELASVHANM